MTSPAVDPIALARTDEKVKSTISELLDPDFIIALQSDALAYDSKQNGADESKWKLAKRVNKWWSEHRSIFGGVKLDYYAECSRVANAGLASKRKRFSDSGETLRRWCEVQETYENFPEAELFLEALSFEHLRVAKSLTYHKKVGAPILALAKAQSEKWDADEMKLHFDPPIQAHEYDKAVGYFSGLAGLKFEWIKNKADRDAIKMHIAKAGEIAERYK